MEGKKGFKVKSSEILKTFLPATLYLFPVTF